MGKFDRWDLLEREEIVAVIQILRDTIQRGANLQPSAILLPLSVLPELDALGPYPVIRGDRVALVYEPKGIN